MKIFVTGGTGFVGRHAVQELSKHGHTLLVLSRHKQKATKNISYLHGDLSTIGKWKNALKRFKPEVALHMAWEGIPDYGPETSIKNLVSSIELTRVLGTLGCKKMVSTGSCWEYGAETGEIGEDSRLKILNPFPAAKIAFHRIGDAIAKTHGMQFVWARIFYVYGPGQKSVSLIPHLIETKMRGAIPEVKNPNGGNDFIYVEDVARALRIMIEKKTPSAVYNLGSGKVTGVREIAKIIFGKDVIPGKGKPVGFYADITRAKRELGWKPRVKIKDGIHKMIVLYP